ncbi:MAG: DUF2723 domain-containing protein [Phycisphaerae bacterium]|nr:DUF2723 domain-containing protein [Phycisphaerae bacterium]
MESPGTTNLTPRRQRRLGFLRWLGVVLFFAVLYGLTAQRGVNWQDSGILQHRILTGNYEHYLGLALAHPLYIALGRGLLWIGGREHLPLLTNLLSAAAMAVAMGNLAAVATRLSNRRWIGVLIAGMVGLSHTVWWLATISETYPLLLAGLTGELLLLTSLVRRPSVWTLAGLALLSGLGVCVHNLALLPLPVYVIVMVVLIVRRRLPAWSPAVAAGAYILGAGLFLAMILNHAVREGGLAGAISSALVGDFGRDVANVAGVSSRWKENAVLSAMNFLNPLLLLAVVGWIQFRRRLGGTLAAALGAISILEIVFFIRYPVPDQFMFILPSLVMIAAAAAVGLRRLAVSRIKRVVITVCLLCLPAQPLLYDLAPHVAHFLRGAPPARHPFRDEWRYWLSPWKQNEHSAEHFSQVVCRETKPDALVLLDSTSLPPLQAYLLSTQQREDILATLHKPLRQVKDDHPAMFPKGIERPIYIRPEPSETVLTELFGEATCSPISNGILYRVKPANP